MHAKRNGTVISADTRIKQALEVCETTGKDLHAIVRTLPDQAHSTATYLDALSSSGVSLGALHGVPVCVKDIIDVAGVPTQAGSLTRSDAPPAERDAFVVARLRAAGAVIVAKSHTVEYAFGGWGTNANLGTPRNPWDKSIHRAPGGSSSGTGVAVGGGLLPGGLGTDTGGSVRLPAAFCGCVGLKTSIGLVSRAGVVPLSDTFDTVGPLTDTVRLAAEMLDAMQGEDRNDPSTLGITRRDPLTDLDKGITGLTLAVLEPDDLPQLTPEVAQAYARAQQILQTAGASLRPVKLPLDLQSYQNLASEIVASDAYAFHANLADDPNAPLNETTRARMLAGKSLTARDRIVAQRNRSQVIAEFLSAIDRCDALVIPTAPMVAQPVDGIDEGPIPMSLYTRLVNYLALAGLAVPIGLTAQGLPTSLQIIVRHLDDPLALRVGQAFEVARGAL